MFLFSERIIVVSEYIGRSLNDLNRKLSHKEITNVGRQVSKALAFIHKQGMTHRTLSPDNILLDDNQQVKLYNYGLFHMTAGGSDVAFPLG